MTRFLNHLREAAYDQTLVLELAPREFPDQEERILESLLELHAYLAAETRTGTESGIVKSIPELTVIKGGMELGSGLG